MKTPLYSICSTLLLATVGCRHSPVPKPVVLPSTLPEPVGVRLPERVHTYQVGRSADPGAGDLLHEAHSVYRLEQEARWDLRPAISTGFDSAPLRDPALAVLPLTDELAAELHRQKTVTRAVMRQAEQLAGALASLESLVATWRTLAQEQKALRRDLARLQERLPEPVTPPPPIPPVDVSGPASASDDPRLNHPFMPPTTHPQNHE